MQDNDRNDDIVIVTGASRGIGAAIAGALAGAGWRVGCLSRTGVLPAGLTPALAERCIGVPCDVTDAHGVAKAFTQIAGQGRIAGLVNNAGVHIEGPSETFSLADYDTVMRTNAQSVLLACQAVYPCLVGRGGLIVNIGSFFDKLGVKRNLAYCASKAAVGAMTRCLAVEWARQSIRLVNVAPGYVVTDLNREAMEGTALRAHLEKRIPAGQPADASQIARLVALLFGADLPFLTGETIYIDGAQGVQP